MNIRFSAEIRKNAQIFFLTVNKKWNDVPYRRYHRRIAINDYFLV